MKTFLWIAVVAALPLIGYNIWANIGKDYSNLPQPGAPQQDIISMGTASARGNLVGIQPYFIPADYCDEQHFMHALHPYFEKARAASLLQQRSIVILPEYTGTWLAFANEKAAVYQYDSARLAISDVVNANIFRFISKLLFNKADDKIRFTLFKIKAGAMAGIYQRVFSSLAREFRVTIVAGSIVLPDPSVDLQGRLHFNAAGPQYNAAFVFGPDGRIIGQPVKKIFLTPDEKAFLTPGLLSNLPVTQTTAGKMAVLLSSDSRHAEAFSAVKGRVEILAVPYLEESTWNTSWKVRKPAAAATAADSTPVRGDPAEAGMDKLASRAGIRKAMRVNYAGRMWEMHEEGNAAMLQHDSLTLCDPILQKGRIINLWL